MTKPTPYLSAGLSFLRDLTRAEAAQILREARRSHQHPYRLCRGVMYGGFGVFTLHTKP